MDFSNQALIVFVTTQVLNIITLIIDYILIKNNVQSITCISVKYPAVGISLIIFECICPVSLGLHFYFSIGVV